MRKFSPPLLLLALLAVTAGEVLAQGMPTSQPGILTIFIEDVKVGMEADHAANEAGWPAAFAKANSPYYYMALESMTGSGQVWYLSPYESFAAEGENMKQTASNPALADELDRLWRADAQYLDAARSIQAIARPDLGHGEFPDLAMVRFYDITTVRIRLGHGAGWENAARLYLEQVQQAAPQMSYRIYQVINGMPDGHFLIFSAVEDYADFDRIMADGMAMWENVGPEVMSGMEQFMANDAQSFLTHRFRVSPTMSYVSEEARAMDPSFWK